MNLTSGHTFCYRVDTAVVNNKRCVIIDDRVTPHGDNRFELVGKGLTRTIYKQEVQTKGRLYKNPVHGAVRHVVLSCRNLNFDSLVDHLSYYPLEKDA